ncbi:MAG TPA: IcmT/TraK family protein [Alphaproteobacteria bacterium]
MANAYSHWRNTARPARFFGVDARACLVVLLFLVHIRVWTLVLMVVVLALSFILERFGMTLPVAMRRVRLFCAGPYRRALVKSSTRRFTDRGGF